jgi:hypothetical protein
MSTPTSGTCPVCNGSLRSPAGDGPYRHFCAGYHASDNTFPCQNCGGQKMFGSPSGKVPLRPDGTPCTHEYHAFKGDNRPYSCVHYYRCIHCNDQYEIDSGD